MSEYPFIVGSFQRGESYNLLIECSKLGYLEWVKYLVSQGADVDSGYFETHRNLGCPCLSKLSSRSSHLSLRIKSYSQSCLREWILMNDPVKLFGDWYIHINTAARVGSLRLVLFLVSLNNQTSDQTVYQATVCGHLEILMFLIDKWNLDEENCGKHAIDRGHLDILKYLLDVGIKIPDACYN